MPDFPIIDAHVHLWNPDRFRISWLDGNTTLNKPYGLEEYRAHASGVDVEAIVYVEVCVDAPYMLLEAQWATGLARTDT
ncbi:MAG: amidohydrolase, partial [Ktedonobacteraceae bacterium]|nr:amidohydrolase [Ktedonobacteraceae bacterium]